MIKFCYGVLLQILQLCSPRKTTQKFLCGTMFLAVNPAYDIRDDDGIVGHLKDCSREIANDVTDEIDNVDAKAICACFETEIIPRLNPDEVTLALGALAYIVSHADNIENGVEIGTLHKTNKRDYEKLDKIEPAPFLTDIFIFAVKAIANKAGQDYIGIVTKDYLRSLPFDPKSIELVSASHDYNPILTSTIRSRNFERAFEEITSSQIGLSNPNELRFFRLANYFLRFSGEYRNYHNLKSLGFNDWYEFVEYGTWEYFPIKLQKNGFSREVASFINKHEAIYTVPGTDPKLLRRTLLNCPNASARREAQEVLYNMPELFEEE